MVPVGVEGKIVSINSGKYHVTDVVCEIETSKGIYKMTLMQKWPVRRGRPYAKKLSPDMPLVTGQRVIDTMFPFAKVSAYAASSVDITLRVWCKSSDYWDLYFELLETIRCEFDKNGISIPYNQLDVHIDGSEK